MLANVMLQLVNDPELAAVLLSDIQRFQTPFGFCPLLAAVRYPSGKKLPVKGEVPNLIGLMAPVEKQVLV